MAHQTSGPDEEQQAWNCPGCGNRVHQCYTTCPTCHAAPSPTPEARDTDLLKKAGAAALIDQLEQLQSATSVLERPRGVGGLALGHVRLNMEKSKIWLKTYQDQVRKASEN